MFKKLVFALVLFALLAGNVIEASADGPRHRKTRKAIWVPTCETVAKFAAPQLASYYFPAPDGGDPTELTAWFEMRYSDYLGDYTLWFRENRLCNNLFQPEAYYIP